ncbi:MAG: protein-L-isoaspartate(D-aspartate) O-methyltransferase, partial [Pseudomonadota bacterium]
MNKLQLIKSLKNQGFSEKILKAFRKVKREDFVPMEFKESAYEDIPLPIGLVQTISQPYTIAFMLNLLE